MVCNSFIIYLKIRLIKEVNSQLWYKSEWTLQKKLMVSYDVIQSIVS